MWSYIHTPGIHTNAMLIYADYAMGYTHKKAKWTKHSKTTTNPPHLFASVLFCVSRPDGILNQDSSWRHGPRVRHYWVSAPSLSFTLSISPSPRFFSSLLFLCPSSRLYTEPRQFLASRATSLRAATLVFHLSTARPRGQMNDVSNDTWTISVMTREQHQW